MKITGLETYIVGNPWKRWVFVQLETSTGLQGISEATLYGESSAVVAELEERKKYYIDSDPFQIEKNWNEWYRDSFNRNASAVNVTAMGAVETACWDLLGKHYGAPIHALFGGDASSTVKVYANGWYTGARSADDFGEKAKEVKARGYTALKFDPFGTAYMSATQGEVERAIERVRAVREAVGDYVDILVEGHGRFKPETAVRIAKLMEEYNPRWFEEPVPPEDIMALREVKSKTTIPIASGERVLTNYGFAPLIESRAVDVVQPDLVNTGGIMQGKKISALAEPHFITVAPHQAEGPVATAACLQLDACIPNFEIQESFDEFDVEWRNDLLKEALTVEGGEMKVPTKPGLGVELDMRAVEEHLATDVTEFNIFQEGWEDRNMKGTRRTKKRR